MTIRNATVDGNGDIFVHILGDVDIGVSPGLGAPSFTGRAMKFEIVGTGVSIALVAHPTLANSLRLLGRPSDFTALAAITNFAIVDRTGGAELVRWSGRFTRYQ